MNKLNLILVVFLLVSAVAVLGDNIPATVTSPTPTYIVTRGVAESFRGVCSDYHGNFATRAGNREICTVDGVVYTSLEQLNADLGFLGEIKGATTGLTNAKYTLGGKDYTYPSLDYSADYKVASTALLDYGLGFFKIADIATEYYKMKNAKVGGSTTGGLVEIKEPKIKLIGEGENENYEISYKIAVNDKTEDYFVNYKIEFMDSGTVKYLSTEELVYSAGDDKVNVPMTQTIKVEIGALLYKLTQKEGIGDVKVKSITIEVTSPDKTGIAKEHKFVVRTDSGFVYDIKAWLGKETLDVQFYLNDIWKGYYYQVDVNGRKYPDFRKSGSDFKISIPASDARGLNSVDVYVYESSDSPKEREIIKVVIKERKIIEAKDYNINAYYVGESMYVVFESLAGEWEKYLYGFKIADKYESEKNIAGSDLVDVPQKIAVKQMPSSVRINYYKPGSYFSSQDDYVGYLDMGVQRKDSVDCKWFKTKYGCKEHTDLCEWTPTEGTGPIEKGEIWISNIRDSKAGSCGPKAGVAAPVTTGGAGGVSAKTMQQICKDYGAIINDAATQNGVDASLIAAVIYQESRGDPLAISSTGAAGLGQFIAETAKDYFADKEKIKPCCPGKDKNENIMFCSKAMAKCGSKKVWCSSGGYNCDENDPRFKPELSISAIAKYLKFLEANNDEIKALSQYGGDSSGSYAQLVLSRKASFESEMKGENCGGGETQQQTTTGLSDPCLKINEQDACMYSPSCDWVKYDRTFSQKVGYGVGYVINEVLAYGLKSSVNWVNSWGSDTPVFDIPERTDPSGHCVSKLKVIGAKIDENEYFKVTAYLYKEKYLEIEFKLGEKYQDYYFTINIGDKEYQSKRRGADLIRSPIIITGIQGMSNILGTTVVETQSISDILAKGITILGYEKYDDQYVQKERKISINDIIKLEDVPCSHFSDKGVCEKHTEECIWNSGSDVCDIKVKISPEAIKPVQLRDGVDYTISANIYQNEYLEIKFNLKNDIMKDIYYDIYLGKELYKSRLSGNYLLLNPRIIIPKSDFISKDLRVESEGIKVIGYVMPPISERISDPLKKEIIFEKVIEAKRINQVLCGLYNSRKECVTHNECEWGVEEGILASAERIAYINAGVEIPGYCEYRTSYIKGKDYYITAEKAKTSQGENYVLVTFTFQNEKMKAFKYDVKVGGKDINKEKVSSDELEKKSSVEIINEVDIYNAQTKGIEVYGYSRNPATNEEEAVFSAKVIAK